MSNDYTKVSGKSIVYLSLNTFENDFTGLQGSINALRQKHGKESTDVYYIGAQTASLHSVITFTLFNMLIFEW